MFHLSISIIQLISTQRKHMRTAFFALVTSAFVSSFSHATQPDWVLSGTVLNSDNAHAMFVEENGDELLVELGDVIQGCYLIDVFDDSAKLRCKGNDYTLQLRSSVGDILLQDEYERSLRQKETVVLSKEEVSTYIKEKQRLVSEISFLPLVEGQQIVGFTLSKIRPDTKAASLGLHNGDIIKSVNGVPASQSEQFMQTVQSLAEVPEVTVEVDRYGQMMAYTFILE